MRRLVFVMLVCAACAPPRGEVMARLKAVWAGGSPTDDVVTSLDVGPSGDVVLAGTEGVGLSAPDRDAALVRIGHDGAASWTRWSEPGAQDALQVAADDAGLWVVGAGDDERFVRRREAEADVSSQRLGHDTQDLRLAPARAGGFWLSFWSWRTELSGCRPAFGPVVTRWNVVPAPVTCTSFESPLDSGVTTLREVGDELVVAGWFFGSLEVQGCSARGGSGRNLFVARLGLDGACHRLTTRPGEGEAFPFSGAIGDDGSVVLGVGAGPSFTERPNGDHPEVVHFDVQGAVDWERALPATTGVGMAPVTRVAVDPAGEVAVVGPFTRPIDLGHGLLSDPAETGLFMLTLTAGGEPRWSGSWRGKLSASAVAFSHEEWLIAGQFSRTVDFGDGARSTTGDDWGDWFLLRLTN